MDYKYNRPMFLNINKSKSNNIWYIVDNSNLNWGIKTERDDCLCKKIRTTHNFLNKYSTTLW